MGCINAQAAQPILPIYDKGPGNCTFMNGTNKCSGYLSTQCTESKQGLILIQQWWGLNISICKTADFFAKQRIMVLVPDLYGGKVAHNQDEAQHLMENLNFPGAVQEINAAKQFLKSKGCVNISITGFCMGGALSFAAASQYAFDGVYPFYGTPDFKYFPISGITSKKVIAFFGGKDSTGSFAGKQAVENVRKQFKQAGKQIQIKVYEQADHAFMNQDRKEVFNQQLSEKCLRIVVKSIRNQ